MEVTFHSQKINKFRYMIVYSNLIKFLGLYILIINFPTRLSNLKALNSGTTD